MALAAANPTADPIVNTALNGTPNLVDSPAPPFTLTNESGAVVSLQSLAGRTVVLTFLDPTCTSDCPLIAQELRVAVQARHPLLYLHSAEENRVLHGLEELSAEFFAGFFSCEHPFDFRLIGVALKFPGGDFGDKTGFVVNATIEALAAQNADLDLHHIEPTGVFGRVVKFQPF